MKLKGEVNFLKCKVFLIILVSIMFVLSGCEDKSTSTIIEFEDYDLSDLTLCLDAMMDENDTTVCLQEDGEEYLTAYANHFIQYLDQQATTYVSLSYNTKLYMNISFDELPTLFGQDSIDIMNQVVQKIHFDISDIIINELEHIIAFRPDVIFFGVEVVGLFENYDIASFQYINRQGTPEIYLAEMRYYEDTVLTVDFGERLDRLEEVLDEQSANHFRVMLSNGIEYVMVNVVKVDNEYSILVDAEGSSNTTELTISDFLSQVEERFPDYTYLPPE